MMLRSLLLIVMTTGALAGCGLKGPLYLPKQEGQETSTSGTSTPSQKKDRTRDSGSQTAAAPGDMGTPPPPTLPREN